MTNQLTPRTTVFIAASLDGFIAREDGDISWLTGIENPANDDYGFREFMDRIDAVVMGRGTFEVVLAFPSWMYTKKVFVLSSMLKEVPAALKEKAEAVNMAPNELPEYLAGRGYYRLYIDGGKTIQGFLKEDLIDELIITRIPVLLGSGIPLFGPLPNDIMFRHIETKVYENGLVKSSYIRERG